MTEFEKPTRFYRLCRKVNENRNPVATIDGGTHRLDLDIQEYAELRELLFGDGEKVSKE